MSTSRSTSTGNWTAGYTEQDAEPVDDINRTFKRIRLFVVASVGMAVGGGLYLTAVFRYRPHSALPVPAGKCRAEKLASQAGGAHLRGHRASPRMISRRK